MTMPGLRGAGRAPAHGHATSGTGGVGWSGTQPETQRPMPIDVMAALARHPRVRLAMLPTPLHEVPRLRDALGGPERCPRILLKRDDLTGLAGGGNKARKLEFLVADALARGATWLVTTGGAQSNHARMTAAAARAYGLGVSLVLTTRTAEPEVQGNLLLDCLFGAEVQLVAPADDPSAVSGPGEAEAVATVARDLWGRGETPYVIPLGGSTAIGALGYVAGTLELADQLANPLAAPGEQPTRLYVAAGSNGTAAGLALGVHLAGLPMRVHGVAVAGPALSSADRTIALAAETAALLGLPAPAAAPALDLAFDLDVGQVGPGYGRATPACLEAIRLLARSEGILLDPVYTGKAMAGLIADIRAGSISPAETVVFLHTGGLPGIFGQARELAAAAAD
jgi:D-cysteine desulfhydrase family pyridoxal phosphate-dependent enzyme